MSLLFQALAQERLGGYRLHVEQAREEIEALQASIGRIYSRVCAVSICQCRNEAALPSARPRLLTNLPDEI